MPVHAREGFVNDRHHVDETLHTPVGRPGGPGLYTTSSEQFMLKFSKE
jgi:hypothetical protein